MNPPGKFLIIENLKIDFSNRIIKIYRDDENLLTFITKVSELVRIEHKHSFVLS